MSNCFSKSKINDLIKEGLKSMFNKISQSCENKVIIDNDEKLKQIRNEFNYIKK